MKIIYLLQNDSDTWGNVVVFIIVGIAIFVNVIRKAIQNAQKGQGGQGQAPKPRSRFLDLIEEVKRMAEEGGEQKNITPKQQPPFIKTEHTTQRPIVVPPTVPKLKPVGGARTETPVYQPQAMKPIQVQKPVMMTAIEDEDEDEYDFPFEDEMMFASEAKKKLEAREKALRRREEALKIAEERLLKNESKIREERLKYKLDKTEAHEMSLIFGDISDYNAVFQSPESLKDAIVLREILGPPRAVQRQKGYTRI